MTTTIKDRIREIANNYKEATDQTTPQLTLKDFLVDIAKDLAGKKADFTVKVKEIRKKNIPNLDDEFAKDLGDFKTMKEVQADMEKRIAQAKESQEKGALYNQILKQLVENTQFEIPESLIHSELSHMMQEFAHELSKRGQKIEDMDIKELVKEFQPEAENRVRSFLILDQIAQEAKIDVTEEELEGRLAVIAQSLKKPLPEIKSHYEKNHLLGSLKNRLIHEKTLEFVLNESKIRVVKAKKEKK
ncbi:MAG: hypothetical protein Q7T03_06750 [Deltaproteobacteria bacterium]|nr:hypothetical protein [Deltaproteobacteria bacterium]